MAKEKTTKEKVEKTPSQLSKELGVPEAITVQVDGQSVICSLRVFSSGNKGYNMNGKILVSGKKCQVSGNIVIVGSKDE